MKLPISLVVAITPDFGIGYLGKLPWSHVGIRLATDMKHFRDVTTFPEWPRSDQAVGYGSQTNCYNAVIMGRKTWESIPLQYRPLPNRLNIIISNSLPSTPTVNTETTIEDVIANPIVCSSLQQSIDCLSSNSILQQNVKRIVVIGGVQLFEEALLHPWCDEIHLTEIISPSFPCDTYLSPKSIEYLKTFPNDRKIVIDDKVIEEGVEYRIMKYRLR